MAGVSRDFPFPRIKLTQIAPAPINLFDGEALAAAGAYPATASRPLPVAADHTLMSRSPCMCGIVGYVGRSEAAPILLDGLRRLEYRGYDSAGVAIVDGDRVETRKCAGRIAALGKLMAEKPPTGTFGISHTRWATHGKPTDQNAHPHFDASGKLALVHNGVIENYQALKDQLVRDGDRHFSSETDTEVLAHLIGKLYDASIAEAEDAGSNGEAAAPLNEKGRLVDAVRAALRQVIGTYGIALVHRDIPDFIVGARRGSPLVLGVGKEENFLASDVSAIVAYTRDAVYLNDFDVVAVERDKFEISSVAGEAGNYQLSKVEFSDADIKKGDYPHYMLKEIFEQPGSVRDAMRGRLSPEECTAKLGGLNMTPAQLRDVGRIVLTGCGTALHAAMIGEYLIEALAQIPTEVEYASEFRHRNTPMTRDTLVFAISQSGETADTLGALRESRRKGYRTLGICNNVASTIARESDGGVYMHAGPEIGVAATKSFTSQVAILTAIGLLLGRMRHLSTSEGTRIIEALEALPGQIEEVLEAKRPDQGDRQEIRVRARHALLRPPIPLSRRARGGAQDEGDHLSFRRRPSERRAQARHHRARPARASLSLHRAG